MIDEDLRYEVSDQAAEVSLARRPVNALSLSLLEQLIAAFERAAVDENGRRSRFPRPRQPDCAGRETAGRSAGNGPGVCEEIADSDADGARCFLACQRS
jgi:hypothetical protein